MRHCLPIRDADQRLKKIVRVGWCFVPEEPVVIMSNRILISLILTLCAGAAAAESGPPATTISNPTLQLGSSDWLLYRPRAREAEIHDLDYMMSRLRCDLAEVGVRFSRSENFRVDLTLAPLTDRRDFIGPVYDMDIGATRLTVSFSF
jgi:hypothetical protein